MNIVWFKRDLRIYDHKPLHLAAQKGKFIPLYIIEPDLWKQPDLSHRQYLSLLECLQDLSAQLSNLGQELIIKVGNAIDIFEEFDREYDLNSVFAHQETGNLWTYARDKLMIRYFNKNKISFNQYPQNGVIRGLKSRDGWSRKWYQFMSESIYPAPRKISKLNIISDKIPTYDELDITAIEFKSLQKMGRENAENDLYSFLNHRGISYTTEMSSPVTAYTSCSRLSVHISFGILSIKEIYHSATSRVQYLKNNSTENKTKWMRSLRSFLSRLRWHCHFIQKLEDFPELEIKNMNRLYDNLRSHTNDKYLNAWMLGNTGFPMIDASMRALISTGWINFRMRAMLISFASYHLWIPWNETAKYLARLFLDYEAGIHFSQVQMQSGTTGINAIRIYNPIKQGIDQDPDGVFIRKWLPELKKVDDQYIHQPWLEPNRCHDYPDPIVDEAKSRKKAASILYGIRKDNSQHQEINNQILDKHGSRRKKITKKKDTKQKKDTKHQGQGEFPF